MRGRPSLRVGCLLVLAAASAAAAGREWERLPDGSLGQVMEARGAGGVPIAAYIRKPDRPGQFPVVVVIHGGGNSKAATYALGRSVDAPIGDLAAAGWAGFSLDFRQNPRGMMDPLEWDDTIAAVAWLRSLPYIDGKRVALLGGSHGANVIARLASRLDAGCGVLCTPAALDLPLLKQDPAARPWFVRQ